jgi:bifunctional non-homologous end joining protein LigD
MTLETYNEKRHFRRTREPRGRVKKTRGGFAYVIQKHAASHLHYDFRLELDGVLLSWAVPKGPSLDPRDKRLAMQVEDHPVEYGGFEGTIPEGEYGGGTVMLWDRGTWEPEGDPRRDYERGRLTFTLHGEKLKGKWHLVRSRGGRGERTPWLLFKGADDEARRSDGKIVDAMPASVATGRSLDEIAAEDDRTWHSKEPAKKRATKLPKFTPPELATLVKEAPEGDGWLHEVKLDGYRILAHVARGKVTLYSRNGKDWTARMPEVESALRRLDCSSAILDGEVVVLGEDGVSDFQRLQNAMGSGEESLTYFAFDLLELDGRDLRSEPLEARKAALAKLVPRKGVVRFGDHVVGGGPEFFAKACKVGLEGIVSKRRDAPYREGRGRDWLKVKCVGRQELVIVGWTDPKSSRAHFGALLLGVRKGKDLVYAGKVGTGFSQESLASIAPKLRALATKTPQVKGAPRGRSLHWVEPKLVCEVDFTEMTSDGKLRHPSFRGLRQDKPASEVVLERPARSPARASPRVSNEHKVFFPESGITKGQLAAYLERVAPWMLPHVARRPLMLWRCPNGIGRCFVQKHVSTMLPPAVRAVDVGDTAKHAMIDDLAGLLGLAQAGVIEIHTWGSHAETLEHPDLLVFDLDPDPSVKWPDVVWAAQLLRERLEDLRLEPFVKTTGGKGLHVVCAIEPTMTWDAAKDFARTIAEAVVKEEPSRFVSTMAKAKRKGKIFIDYLRNGRGATFVAPYSPRARAGAPIAMPIDWDELTNDLQPDQFTVRNAFERLDALKADPWEKLGRIWTRPRKSTTKARSTSTSRSKG